MSIIKILHQQMPIVNRLGNNAVNQIWIIPYVKSVLLLNFAFKHL